MAPVAHRAVFYVVAVALAAHTPAALAPMHPLHGTGHQQKLMDMWRDRQDNHAEGDAREETAVAAASLHRDAPKRVPSSAPVKYVKPMRSVLEQQKHVYHELQHVQRERKALPKHPALQEHTVAKMVRSLSRHEQDMRMLGGARGVGLGSATTTDLDEEVCLTDEDLKEVTVNATIGCRDPGCAANTTVEVFDPSEYNAKQCYFTLYIHPTDFDDQYAGERLEYVRINNHSLNFDWAPMENGCNSSTDQLALPAIVDFPVDSLLVNDSTGDVSGYLFIEAAISDWVDECAYDGQMLAGVASVTCLLADKLSEPQFPVPNGSPVSAASSSSSNSSNSTNTSSSWSQAFTCPDRGCTAHAQVAPSGVCNLSGVTL
eukprot:NODE_9477_length_1422_cov_3.077220.p1 GENE.NODE_9477_length_1422_cov_3.077220~~NODE_9477_length_1422_cov_3.077220.p1  ORF type:complete len:373 (+),score=85.65 NODE_9477_length_1422_cov_3.077220:95-1213(+)